MCPASGDKIISSQTLQTIKQYFIGSPSYIIADLHTAVQWSSLLRGVFTVSKIKTKKVQVDSLL